MVGGLHCVGVEGLEVLPNVLCTAQWKNLLDGQRSSSSGEDEHQF